MFHVNRQTIHMKCQVLFCLKNNAKINMSSARILLSILKVNQVLLTHLYRVDSSTLIVQTGLFPAEGVFGKIYYYLCYRHSWSLANSVNPDQTPQNAASDLGLRCSPISLL